MNNELMKYAKGEVRPRMHDREAAAKAKEVYDEIRLAALKADGTLALAGHIMEGVLGLNERRITLSDGDPVTSAMLAEIQAEAFRRVKRIQSGLFSDFGI